MSGEERQRPRAFRLDDAKVLVSDGDPAAAADFRKSGGVVIQNAPDAFAPDDEPTEPKTDEQAVEIAQKRGLLKRALFTWGGLFWSALGGLVSLGFSVWTARVVDDLFERSQALGWIGVALAGVLLVAILGLLARESRAILRQRRIAHLHVALADARANDDRGAARKGVGDLIAIYAARPETARARKLVEDLTREIVDAPDLLDIAERNLMKPLDDEARREIAVAAKRVSMVTALSPRALIDVAFVAAQAVRLLRRISEVYGGRPGFFGFLRLARSVGAHLAITGGMAIGDTLVQQVLGHGIAARLSAKLGEGVLNGMLTTRIGLSAMAVCRPMPFVTENQPGVKDVAPFLFGGDKS
ncbi:MAG: TIGR01620 family protein [Hyphomicrobiales bacterium]|nr:TIGR01620 family protein [Hyphomicrobiales bacterium]